MEGDPGTVPLDATYYETVTYHDRVYQRYAVDNGAYFAPVDEDEQERLRIQHEVFQALFDGRLIFPPIQSPRRILECGFGTASWATDVADQYPRCEVIGIDISPHMRPQEQPPNLDLQVDDLNQQFSFPANYFDLVHSQLMVGGIHANRWLYYLRDINRVLRRGGWCQMVEIYFNVQSDNGTLTGDHALRRWSQAYLQSLQPYKDPRAPLQLENLMRQAGFVDVESRLLPLHLCGWSNNTRDYNIGVANRENVHRLLSSLVTYPLTEFSNMSIEDVQLLVTQARAEADNPAFKVESDAEEVKGLLVSALSAVIQEATTWVRSDSSGKWDRISFFT